MTGKQPTSRHLLAALLSACLLWACGRTEDASTPAVEPSPVSQALATPKEWALAIHGGAGVIAPEDTDADAYFASLERALRLGANALAEGRAALEVVELVVRDLEDDPRFNAGRGAVLTAQGTHELDAAIMDGRTLEAGAVAGVRNVRNPIELARKVLEESPHVLLAGEGADDFAREVGVRRAPQDYFTTERRLRQWRETRQRERSRSRTGGSTVGAVALDRYGNVAAATSTGGLTNKRYGRVGDVPLIGAGTYANNRSAAISCTGKGEEFIRHAVAHDISSRMLYRGLSLRDAAQQVIFEVLAEGDGGMIGVDAQGHLAMVFNTPGMFRGAADSSGRFELGIWHETRKIESTGASGASSR